MVARRKQNLNPMTLPPTREKTPQLTLVTAARMTLPMIPKSPAPMMVMVKLMVKVMAMMRPQLLRMELMKIRI